MSIRSIIQSATEFIAISQLERKMARRWRKTVKFVRENPHASHHEVNEVIDNEIIAKIISEHLAGSTLEQAQERAANWWFSMVGDNELNRLTVAGSTVLARNILAEAKA